MPQPLSIKAKISITILSVGICAAALYFNWPSIVPCSLFTLLMVASYVINRRSGSIVYAGILNWIMITGIMVAGPMLFADFPMVRWVIGLTGYTITTLLLYSLSKQVVDLKNLRQSEERLELAIDAITAGLWDWNLSDGDKRWWSARYYELLGYAPNEIEASGANLKAMTHPDDIELAARTQTNYLQKEEKFEIEQRYKTKNGEYKWFLVNGQVKFNDKGQPARMIGSIIDIDEKKRAQELIVEQAALIETIPHAIVYGDSNLNIYHMNKAAEKAFGVNIEHVKGKRLLEVVPYETTGQTAEEVRSKMFGAEGAWRGEVVFHKKDGSKLITLASARIITNAKGEFTGWVGIYTDISELKATQERLQLAIEGTAAGIWDWIDIDADAEWWSTRFYQLLGYEQGEITPAVSTFRQILHPDDFAETIKKQENHFNNRGRFEMEYRLKTKEGLYKWFLGSGQAKFNAEGKPTRMVGSIIDINERKQAENAIQEYASLIKMMPDGVVRVAKSRMVVSVNDNAQKMFEATEEEMMGRPLDDFINMNILGTTREQVWTDIWTKGFWRGEVEITTRSGKKHLLLVNIKANDRQDGTEPTWVGVYTDISLLRLNEELHNVLKRLEDNNRYLEQFAYISSHDIKAPIIAVDGLVDLMYKTNAVKEDQIQILDMLKSTTSQMQRTNHSLNSILKLRKNLLTKSEEDAHSASLQLIMDDIMATLKPNIEAADATVNIDLNGYGDMLFPYVHLKSVLYNLISNAIKYRDPAKPLIVNVKAKHEAGNMYTFMVEDNGLGMDLGRNREKLYGIFKRFHSHVEGSGVGLHIVKSIIEAHEGTIEVKSAPGTGTRFDFTFNQSNIVQ